MNNKIRNLLRKKLKRKENKRSCKIKKNKNELIKKPKKRDKEKSTKRQRTWRKDLKTLSMHKS